MLRRYNLLNHDHFLESDSETESDDLSDYFNTESRKRKSREENLENKCDKSKTNKKEKTFDEESRSDMKASKEEPVIRSAEKYQEYMKQIPIPSARGAPISFATWQDLAKSISQLYEQPLHYLTHILLKQWDDSRTGTVDEKKAIDTIIHPNKAEATVWGIEEFHRRCCSHYHLAELWLSDPTYHDFIKQINHYVETRLSL